MSANNAVTVLRSPSGISCDSSVTRTDLAAVELADVAFFGEDLAFKGAPHSLQNLAPALFEAPHAPQRKGSGEPHSLQNLALSAFSAPQLSQGIELIYSPPCIT
jgi:hypothetical protein